MEYSHPKNTIRKEIFQNSMVYSVLLLSCMALIISWLLYKSEERSAHQILKLHNESTNYIIEGHFSELSNIVESLTQSYCVKNGSTLSKNDQQELINYYKTVSSANNKTTHIYSAYANKLLLINNYTPPQDYDPTLRPWFIQAVKDSPNVSIGVPYQDAKYNLWLISTAKAFVDKNNQQGVIAIDTPLTIITNLLNKKAARYTTSKSFITDLKGKVIIHPEYNKINQQLQDIIYQPIMLNASHGEMTYDENGVSKIAYYSRVNETGWLLFTDVNKSEIFTPIIYQVLHNVGLLGLVAVVLALIYSSLFSQSLSNAMVHLKEHVHSITEGKEPTKAAHTFPNNEIGSIANEVLQLTQEALYQRTLRLEQANREIDNINHKLGLKNQALQDLAERDQLTNLFNRRKINDTLHSEQERFMRYHTPFSIVMIDIDHFKRINDQFGHHAGDDVLKELTQRLSANIRKTDILGRWGGEEFMLVCPETTLSQASILSEKIRRLVEQQAFSINQRITISAGATQYSPEDSLTSVLSRVDNNLYQAKDAGRNRIIAE
ncbi:sensor domain-containing diguanylate cyclase [Photobacterium sanguinicancri]|uniref:sensor domain-containing diguanylate cyclase n=1 Tax=Photobacterium sanguinicancri TaxID=875932 RepID=UPI0026E2FD7E|nr:sensor domain-containing diguanylate cyclase [Photobacterium sanguinicancri]MDO6497209.1 sensor domain-containing diguanylate cyclase [Photobacterium sanguinicancri]